MGVGGCVTAGIKVELSGVRAKVSEQAFDRGRYALGNQMMTDMDPFVPKKGGALRQSSHLSGDNKEIIYQMPYAARQFYVQAYNYSTPGTGSRWDLKASSMFMSEWVKVFTKGMGI